MGKNADRIIASAADIWSGYYTHPFVTGIADGSLDRDKFKFYMIQDYLYLFDYARVFALGTVKTMDPGTMRICADYVDRILHEEMEIHKGYMKRLGISPEEAETAVISLDNLSYTSYMLRIAYDGGIAEILAAILSCAVSYEYIGRHIVQNHPGSTGHEFYGEWIGSYSSEGYAEANRALEDLVDKHTAGYSEEQLKNLEQVFINCSRYEALFWDMSWERRL